MEVYFSLLFFVVLIYFYSNIKKNILGTDQVKISNVILFIFLWLVSGLRSDVGTDFIAYKNYFENLQYYSFDYPLYEKGYYALNFVVSLFTTNSQFVMMLTSFIILFLINKTLLNYSNSYLMSVFLFITMYYYLNSFNLVRQYIVVAILFFSLKFIIKENFKKFIVSVIIASLFHITALIMIPFYWILKKRFSTMTYVVLIFATIGLSFATPAIVGIVSRLIPKFALYTHYEFEGASSFSVILITLSLFVFSIFNKNKLIKTNKHGWIYVNAVYFALLFSILSTKNILFFRVAIYFYIYCLLLIPICLLILDKKVRPAAILLVLSTFTYYLYHMISNNNSGVFPYQYNLDIFNNISTGLIYSIVIILLLFMVNLRLIKMLTQKKQKTKIGI